MSIIKSLLDTDLYKITMMQAVFHNFKDVNCSYGFKCRGGENLLPFAQEIKEEISSLGNLSFSKEELDYLRTLPFIKNDFLNYLSTFKLDPNQVVVDMLGKGLLGITVEGKWLETILFEVPILSIVNEVYFRNQCKDLQKAYEIGSKLLDQKIAISENLMIALLFADFGTRRRFSQEWHEKLIQKLSPIAKEIGFIGTSNVDLARRYNLKPIGTMAHEFYQACQVLAPSVELTNQFALNTWYDEYQGQLDTALTDIFGVDAFLADLDKNLVDKYSGFRHDSGDPIEFGNKMIKKLKSLNVDPMSKKLIFSDGLTFPEMIRISSQFKDQINVAFGIGTNLTNDVGLKPLKIVMKMITCNDQPTVKISDSPGKIMCSDVDYIDQVYKMIENKKQRILI